jgi:hypothetical protein
VTSVNISFLILALFSLEFIGAVYRRKTVTKERIFPLVNYDKFAVHEK